MSVEVVGGPGLLASGRGLRIGPVKKATVALATGGVRALKRVIFLRVAPYVITSNPHFLRELPKRECTN